MTELYLSLLPSLSELRIPVLFSEPTIVSFLQFHSSVGAGEKLFSPRYLLATYPDLPSSTPALDLSFLTRLLDNLFRQQTQMTHTHPPLHA